MHSLNVEFPVEWNYAYPKMACKCGEWEVNLDMFDAIAYNEFAEHKRGRASIYDVGPIDSHA